ncbi:MAG TPA: tetratricopeptide repeat protein [Burkholderiales bacterium]|jgi:hypothetical protein
MKQLLAGFSAALVLAFAFAGTPAFAAEPTVHEIYQAAEAGHMDDAQRMIHEVLQAHPNSGKAHYVEADLLAKQGKLHEARTELAAAEKLSPGLPFASAQSVSELRGILDKPAANNGMRAQHTSSVAPAAASSSFPWGLVLAGIFLVLFIAWAARLMTRRSAPSGGYGGPVYQQGGPAPYGPTPGYGPAPGYAPMPGYGAPAPGMGSQILGGLATGAAVGAGIAAGEELIHHMTDGGHRAASNNFSDNGYAPFQSIPDSPPVNDDMGGTDFGISDGSSWDDGGGSGGGGGDWN